MGLNLEPWTRGLKTERFGRSLVLRDLVDSTNASAVAAMREVIVPEGTAFVARRQAHGKGTGGRSWLSDDPDGLWFSLVLQEPIKRHPLSFLPGIALVDLLREEYGIATSLKWPNDVMVEGRKLCGVLVESQLQPGGAMGWVVGVGINVNHERLPDPISDIAVSMRLATGQRFDLPSLFALLMNRLEGLYDEGADLVAMWETRSDMIGRRVEARRDGKVSHVTVTGVSAEGHLQVVFDDGRTQAWASATGLEISQSG